jgi:hypothetical protein
MPIGFTYHIPGQKFKGGLNSFMLIQALENKGNIIYHIIKSDTS